MKLNGFKDTIRVAGQAETLTEPRLFGQGTDRTRTDPTRCTDPLVYHAGVLMGLFVNRVEETKLLAFYYDSV